MRRDELNLSEPPAYDRPGDTWTCGDATGCCPNGPSRKGRCPLADACTPKRTWYGRRRIGVFCLLALGVVTLGIALRPGVAPAVFKPGSLSNPHKQILAGTLTSERCTACHRSASISPTAWFDSAGKGHQDVSQSDRCLDCHHQTIKPNVAKLAHNLPSAVREKIRSRIQLASAKLNSTSWHDRLPGPAIDQENIECSACHREHRGTQADLLAVSDKQCQTCHSDRFGDFASSHPEWNNWPYGRGGDVSFDHQSHMADHFPKTTRNGLAVEFRCTNCHQLTEKNELTRSVSYEVGCQSCHDESLRAETAKGLELVSLPLIPTEAANVVGVWPESAVGMMDGSVTPLAELLMRSDASVTEALRLVPGRNFGRLPPNSPLAQGIVAVAQGHRRLLLDMATQGQPAFFNRAAQAGVSPAALREIIRNLPPQLVFETYERWFGEGYAGMPDQANRSFLGGIRLVDFTEQIQQQRKEQAAENGPSFLLAIDDDNWLDSPRIAQKRTQTRKIIKNLDNASDDDLLGGEIVLPKWFQPKSKNAPAVPIQKKPVAGSNANGPTKQLPAAKPRIFKDPGSLLEIPLDEDSLLTTPPKAGDPRTRNLSTPRPKTDSTKPNDLLGDDLLGGDFPDDDVLTLPSKDGKRMRDSDSLLLPTPSGNDALLPGDMQNDSLLDDGLFGDDDPLAEDPLMEDPLAIDPLETDPLAEDPLTTNDDLLMDGPLSQDPLSDDPLSLAPSTRRSPARKPAKRFNPSEMIPDGGWYRDDIRLSIGYRGAGHSDPVLRAAVEMVRELPVNDPVRTRLLATQSVAACVSCHAASTKTNHSWTGRQLVGDKSQFTKFAHGAHLNIAGLKNCVHCHKIGKDSESQNPVSLAAFSQETNPHQGDGHEFLPMKRATCAVCHTARAAGESCVQCHRYHIEQ